MNYCKRGILYDSSFTLKAHDIEFDSSEELCYSLGFILRNVSSIDAEIPDNLQEQLLKIRPNYPINLGTTRMGQTNKWGF